MQICGLCYGTFGIEKLDRTTILHNAGITGQNTMGYPAFYKGAYHTGKDPFLDTHILKVLSDETTKKHANHYYTQQLIEIKNKYNINY